MDNKPSRDRLTALFDAIEADDRDAVVRLIAGEPTLASMHNEVTRLTPLHLAANHNLSILIDDLVRAGADLEARDTREWTPLHMAAKNGNVEAAERLLSAGANMEARDNRGWTPLMHATTEHLRSPAKSVANLLLGRGAELDLFTALAMGRLDDVRRMIETDPRLAVDCFNAEGLVPLAPAIVFAMTVARTAPCEKSDPIHGEVVGVLKLLVERGAPLGRLDDAIGNALNLKDPMIARYLLELADERLSQTDQDRIMRGRRFASIARASISAPEMLQLLKEYKYAD